MSLYSNFNHELDLEEMAAAMDDGEDRDHCAWNFFGTIRYDKATGLWHEQVKRYHCVVGNYSNASLKDLIEEVNDEHGYE